ncbi:MAG: carboxylating nicotinate-nucleotide diphosphorylase [Phycisphaerales bacterium]|nr:MAG: carboxylating nicotinate-nucleotide diphosphorylase [Phycisphaerales bacterium]
MSLSDDKDIAQLIEMARREDLGSGDLTTDLLPDPNEHASFHLLAKARGVFAGREIAQPVLSAYDETIEIDWSDAGVDGARVGEAATVLAGINGPLGPILSAERVLLNFLQRLSGVATLTRAFVDAVEGTGAQILDTRKTTPGWRRLEKYAVRCGGGGNHRQGLYDGVLIKDNHIAGVEDEELAATVFHLLNRLAQAGAKPAFVEVEADTLSQVQELFKVVGIDVILLDNFSVEDLVRAVELRENCGLASRVALEASGGVNLETVRRIAETGVDRISAGEITHSAVALDLAMERGAC